MSIITLFSGSFCQDQQVVDYLLEQTGYQLLTDEDIIIKAESLSGEPAEKIRQTITGTGPKLDAFTNDKEKRIAYLRLAVADWLGQTSFILNGYTSLLIPSTVRHALSVCLIAQSTFRQTQVRLKDKISEHEAAALILEDNREKATWSKYLLNLPDPWDASLYDLFLPMDKMSPENAAEVICKAVKNLPAFSQEEIGGFVKDFELSAVVQTKLVLLGHDVKVSAQNGYVEIIVSKPVLMQTRLENELKSLTEDIPGVNQVRVHFEPAENGTFPIRAHQESRFSKVLLVDDEREFVETLSERLQMRQMESEAVYDGQAALECVEKDDPEVMIIDLKMPGIDGIEVLRRVKQTRPEIEVIVLTGHGSEQDRTTCMSLGAFAYLQKPVDIDLLSETLRAAHDKIKNNR